MKEANVQASVVMIFILPMVMKRGAEAILLTATVAIISLAHLID